MKLRKKEIPIISFISMVPHLDSIEETIPKLSKNYIPDWWKKTPLVSFNHSFQKESLGNIKNCPSFPDFFSQGFTIPMWADTILFYDDETKEFKWKTADTDFTWDIHHSNQFLDYVSTDVDNSKGTFVFKAVCPWRIVTQPGYSVLQLPMFYHFNHNYSVLPGVIDTDIHHEINQQVMIFSSKKEIFIKRGEPFVTYIPFKRTNFTYAIRSATTEDKEQQNKVDYFMRTKFPGTKQYNAKRRIRDKKYE